MSSRKTKISGDNTGADHKRQLATKDRCEDKLSKHNTVKGSTPVGHVYISEHRTLTFNLPEAPSQSRPKYDPNASSSQFSEPAMQPYIHPSHPPLTWPYYSIPRTQQTQAPQEQRQIQAPTPSYQLALTPAMPPGQCERLRKDQRKNKMQAPMPSYQGSYAPTKTPEQLEWIAQKLAETRAKNQAKAEKAKRKREEAKRNQENNSPSQKMPPITVPPPEYISRPSYVPNTILPHCWQTPISNLPGDWKLNLVSDALSIQPLVQSKYQSPFQRDISNMSHVIDEAPWEALMNVPDFMKAALPQQPTDHAPLPSSRYISPYPELHVRQLASQPAMRRIQYQQSHHNMVPQPTGGFPSPPGKVATPVQTSSAPIMHGKRKRSGGESEEQTSESERIKHGKHRKSKV
jgi:hypothetical protein